MLTTFKSAQFLAEKQAQEAEELIEEELSTKHDRRVLLGFFVISLLATLLISSALNNY